MKNKFEIQEQQYVFPYHYLVDFKKYNNQKRLNWGLEYYSYMNYTIKYISSLSFENLLDVGCGDGRLISELSKVIDDKKQYTGIDLSEPAIYLAKGLSHFKKNVKFICGDFSKIDGLYDVIVLNEVLEHIPDDLYNIFCENIISKLDKDGKIVITVPSDNFPVQKKHFRHYDLEKIKMSFENLDVDDIRYVYRCNFFVKIIMSIITRIPLLRRFELFIGKVFLFKAKEHNCRHIFCVLKK